MSGCIRQLCLFYIKGLLLTSLLVPRIYAEETANGYSESTPAPSIVVLYKDRTGSFETLANAESHLNLELPESTVQKIASIGITARYHGQSTFSDLTSSDTSFSKDLKISTPRRTWQENAARVLIPLAGAALTLGLLDESPSWKRPDKNIVGNAGHMMVMATVNNLVEEVGDELGGMLEQYSLGGVIPPYWQAKGVMAVLVLGYAGLENVGSKNNLNFLSVSRFFAQSRVISHTNLLLGEASGQLLDSLTQLKPEHRKIMTSATGGMLSGSLYYLLSSMMDRDISRDYEGKISNATVFGINRAVLPFVEGYIGQWIDDGTTRHFASNLVMAGVSASASLPLYFLVSHIPDSDRGMWKIPHLLAGSFTKFLGASVGQMFGAKTIRSYMEGAPTTPLAIAASALLLSSSAHLLYAYAGVPHGGLVEEWFFKYRDGLFASIVTGGITAIIEEVVRGYHPQPLQTSLNLRITPAINSDSTFSNAEKVDEPEKKRIKL